MLDRYFYAALTVFILGVSLMITGHFGSQNLAAEPVAMDVAQLEPAAGDSSQSDIGGSFALMDHNGNDVTNETYAGSYKLMFFGFTHCPEICPTGLQKIVRVYDLLDEPENLVTLFVTVDPARDTPAVMKEYVSEFHPAFIGLTGTKGETARMVEAYKAYVDIPENKNGGAYMVNHSAFTYFIGPDNTVIDFFGTSDSAADIAESVKHYLNRS